MIIGCPLSTPGRSPSQVASQQFALNNASYLTTAQSCSKSFTLESMQNPFGSEREKFKALLVKNRDRLENNNMI